MVEEGGTLRKKTGSGVNLVPQAGTMHGDMVISGLSSYDAFLSCKKISCIGVGHYSWSMIFEYI